MRCPATGGQGRQARQIADRPSPGQRGGPRFLPLTTLTSREPPSACVRTGRALDGDVVGAVLWPRRGLGDLQGLHELARLAVHQIRAGGRLVDHANHLHEVIEAPRHSPRADHTRLIDHKGIGCSPHTEAI